MVQAPSLLFWQPLFLTTHPVPFKDGKHPGNVAGGLKAYVTSLSWSMTRAVLMKRQRYYQPERI